MEEELVLIRMIKLKTHHKTPTIYIRDKLLEEYVDKKLLVKVFIIKNAKKR